MSRSGGQLMADEFVSRITAPDVAAAAVPGLPTRAGGSVLLRGGAAGRRVWRAVFR